MGLKEILPKHAPPIDSDHFTGPCYRGTMVQNSLINISRSTSEGGHLREGWMSHQQSQVLSLLAVPLNLLIPAVINDLNGEWLPPS